MIARASLMLAAVLALSSCVSSPIPKGYTGPLAGIKDSVTVHSTSKADFFFLDKVNKKSIEQSVSATLGRNHGRGMMMEPVVLERDVPAQPSTFTIQGTTHYAAPILAFTGTVYRVTGEVSFTPEPNRKYVVKGTLSENYSAVWIEDSENAQVMDRKIEVNGSAAQGFLSK